ncbi:hypothetical protein TYRP_000403 [Tyrophagus putrescentiae]|nr:hypothetical protein TYRP_000403 [Tyrophagus putrescentiae]
MANVRLAIENNPQSTGLGKLYAKCYDATMEKLPKDLIPLVKREFHALFTFSVSLPIQLFYLWYILSGNTEENGFGFISLHFHLLVILFGGAAVRCLVGYLVNGKVLEVGSCYDYVIGGESGSSTQVTGASRSKISNQSAGKKNINSSP